MVLPPLITVGVGVDRSILSFSAPETAAWNEMIDAGFQSSLHGLTAFSENYVHSGTFPKVQ